MVQLVCYGWEVPNPTRQVVGIRRVLYRCQAKASLAPRHKPPFPLKVGEDLDVIYAQDVSYALQEDGVQGLALLSSEWLALLEVNCIAGGG